MIIRSVGAIVNTLAIRRIVPRCCAVTDGLGRMANPEFRNIGPAFAYLRPANKLAMIRER